MIDAQQALTSLLPISIAGWTAEPAEDQLFDPESIFEYIDGAGEVYRAYNFQRLLSRRYSREGFADLVADLFDMGSSRDAFGVFTHDLDGEDAGIGQGSTYKGGLLSFWRDRYFVSLTAEAETAESREALLALGREVAARIGRDGPKPDLWRFLPEGFRDTGVVRYFHTQPVLNYHFFISSENILNLSLETEAVLAVPKTAWRPGGDVLLLIRYPGDDQASAALGGFIRGYMPDAVMEKDARPARYIVRTEDGTWTGAAAGRNLIVLCLQAPSADRVRDMISSVLQGSEWP